MKYLNSKEVSDILGINISTLKRWTDNGTIGCHKTAGGHRKFTMKNIREYYKANKKASRNSTVSLDNISHKKIYSLIKKQKFSDLSHELANASLESNEETVSTIISGSYMNNIVLDIIFDEIKKLKPGQGEEIHITDAIRNLIYNGNKFFGNIFKGKYLDCGTLNGYIQSGFQIFKGN